MVQKLEISGVHSVVNPSLKKYVTKKIGGLDHYLARHVRESVHTEVFLKEGKTKDNNHCTCEVTMHVPHKTIVITESALNMYAAVDIASAKLKLQLKKYKDTHSSGRLQRHLFSRLKRRAPADTPS